MTDQQPPPPTHSTCIGCGERDVTTAGTHCQRCTNKLLASAPPPAAPDWIVPGVEVYVARDGDWSDDLECRRIASVDGRTILDTEGHFLRLGAIRAPRAAVDRLPEVLEALRRLHDADLASPHDEDEWTSAVIEAGDILREVLP